MENNHVTFGMNNVLPIFPGSGEEMQYDIRTQAKSYLMYRIGEGINKAYFPVLVPVGIIGNILSFLVMVQPHNRHNTLSFYISTLACSDTVALILGFATYLNMVHDIDMPPDQFWFCTMHNAFIFMASTASTLLIVSMTFDRFYSIIRPHKAASFNTVKRAKITIACIVVFSIGYNIPHFFISSYEGRQCVPYGVGRETVYNQLFYWFSSCINFIFPFILLLIMNCVIIYTLKSRSHLQAQGTLRSEVKGQGQNEGQRQKLKNSERQVYVILLLVTFSFLILTIPGYLFMLYTLLYNYQQSPKAFAGFHLFYNIGHKTYNTNYAINFFLYVMSGQKFRTDLVKLFKRKERRFQGGPGTSSVDVTTQGSLNNSTSANGDFLRN